MDKQSPTPLEMSLNPKCKKKKKKNVYGQQCKKKAKGEIGSEIKTD